MFVGFIGKNRSNLSGFSLLELLVVVSIIAILMTVTVFGIAESRAQSRDAERKTNIRLVQNALELYKGKYGRYPEACNGPTTSRSGGGVNPSGEPGTSFSCSGGSGEYIVGLVPEFLLELPKSAREVSGDQGYVYLVNNEGSVYKFMALNVVETEEIYDAVSSASTGKTTESGHEFHRCGPEFDVESTAENYNPDRALSHNDLEMCERTPVNDRGNYSAAKTTMPGCDATSDWATTYAISSGYATPLRTNNLGNSRFPKRGEEYDTEIIRCY